MEPIPPGFLTGIHEKLESKSPLSKLMDWFATTPLRLAGSTGVAVLFVGVVTAVVVQNIPLDGTIKTENKVAISKQSKTKAPLPQVAENNTGSPSQSTTDFYPGVPLLSEYEENTKRKNMKKFRLVINFLRYAC